MGKFDTYAELLGLDKGEEWTDQMFQEAASYMRDNEKTFTDMTSDYLNFVSPKFIVVLAINQEVRTLAKINRFFYAIGYMKGLLKHEETDNLNRIWEAGNEDEEDKPTEVFCPVETQADCFKMCVGLSDENRHACPHWKELEDGETQASTP